MHNLPRIKLFISYYSRGHFSEYTSFFVEFLNLGRLILISMFKKIKKGMSNQTRLPTKNDVYGKQKYQIRKTLKNY